MPYEHFLKKKPSTKTVTLAQDRTRDPGTASPCHQMRTFSMKKKYIAMIQDLQQPTKKCLIRLLYSEYKEEVLCQCFHLIAF